MTDDAVFAAIANPTRRELLDLLRNRPQPVSELAENFAMARPSISEHLKVLRDAGLVEAVQRGRQRIYHLDARPLQDIVEWLHPYEEFWRGRLSELRRMLDDRPGT